MLDAVAGAVAVLALAAAIPLGEMTAPTDLERARRIKWREEGIGHEADLPDLPVWAMGVLIGGLGVAIVVASPVWFVGWLWRRSRRWATILLIVGLVGFLVATWPILMLTEWWEQHRRHGKSLRHWLKREWMSKR